jgi:hypothetical protein
MTLASAPKLPIIKNSQGGFCDAKKTLDIVAAVARLRACLFGVIV